MIYTSSAVIFAAAALHTASGYVILPSHHRAGPSVIGTTALSSITPTHHKVFPPKGPGPQTAAHPGVTTTAHREKKPKGQHKGKKNGSKSNCGAPHESASAHTGHMTTKAHFPGSSSPTNLAMFEPGVPFVGGSDSDTETAETATGGKLDQRWEPLASKRPPIASAKVPTSTSTQTFDDGHWHNDINTTRSGARTLPTATKNKPPGKGHKHHHSGECGAPHESASAHTPTTPTTPTFQPTYTAVEPYMGPLEPESDSVTATAPNSGLSGLGGRPATAVGGTPTPAGGHDPMDKTTTETFHPTRKGGGVNGPVLPRHHWMRKVDFDLD